MLRQEGLQSLKDLPRHLQVDCPAARCAAGTRDCIFGVHPCAHRSARRRRETNLAVLRPVISRHCSAESIRMQQKILSLLRAHPQHGQRVGISSPGTATDLVLRISKMRNRRGRNLHIDLVLSFIHSFRSVYMES